VGATIHYYQNLAKAHAARGLELDIMIAHAEIDRVLEFVRADDRNGLAGYLVGFIDRLKAAGAEFAAIPAVTPHFCVKELVESATLPILNIFEPLVREIESRKVKRVAVFGTRSVICSKLFGQVSNVEFCEPMPDELEYIHETYTQLARNGKGTEQQFVGLTSLAQTLQQRDKVEAILLAGTDLSLLFNEANTGFPHIDCATLHIAQILGAMIG
jgi:aspartate racemase